MFFFLGVPSVESEMTMRTTDLRVRVRQPPTAIYKMLRIHADTASSPSHKDHFLHYLSKKFIRDYRDERIVLGYLRMS